MNMPQKSVSANSSHTSGWWKNSFQLMKEMLGRWYLIGLVPTIFIPVLLISALFVVAELFGANGGMLAAGVLFVILLGLFSTQSLLTGIAFAAGVQMPEGKPKFSCLLKGFNFKVLGFIAIMTVVAMAIMAAIIYAIFLMAAYEQISAIPAGEIIGIVILKKGFLISVVFAVLMSSIISTACMVSVSIVTERKDLWLAMKDVSRAWRTYFPSMMTFSLIPFVFVSAFFFFPFLLLFSLIILLPFIFSWWGLAVRIACRDIFHYQENSKEQAGVESQEILANEKMRNYNNKNKILLLTLAAMVFGFVSLQKVFFGKDSMHAIIIIFRMDGIKGLLDFLGASFVIFTPLGFLFAIMGCYFGLDYLRKIKSFSVKFLIFIDIFVIFCLLSFVGWLIYLGIEFLGTGIW